MIKMEIKGLLMDPVSNMPVVILRDTEKGHFLPIWVGRLRGERHRPRDGEGRDPSPDDPRPPEERPRPSSTTRVERVVINDLRENTFFARSTCCMTATLSVDSRPSDAIALALRSHAEIFVEEEVLEKSRNAPRGGLRPGPGPAPQVARGERARTSSANTACRLVPTVRVQRRALEYRRQSALYTPERDHLHHQSEGRRRQDHDRHQPRRRARPEGHEDALIDLDPQGNSTMSYVDRREIEKSMFDVLVGARERNCRRDPPSGIEDLDIAPARISLAKIESQARSARSTGTSGCATRSTRVRQLLRRDPDRHAADPRHDHGQRDGRLDATS